MKNIQEYIEYWNNFIDEWSLDPLVFFKSEKNYWRVFEHLSSNADAMPEPYNGNPFNYSALILNHNPYGGVNYKLQKHREGVFFKDTASNFIYYDFAKTFPYLNKYKETNIGKLWQRRYNWINRVSESTKNPFSIQICPWHWKFYDGKGFQQYSVDYINNFIIKPAEIIVQNAELNVILSIGKEFEHLYNNLGFKHLKSLSRDPIVNNRNYPLGKNGLPIKRYYNIWESPNGLIYLNTFTVGTNECPSSDFQDVENEIMYLLMSSGQT